MEYTKSNDQYLIRLLKDEDLFEQLGIFAREEKLKSGEISGIGALKEVELGSFHLKEKDYHRKMFNEGDYELLNMSGNLSLLDGNNFFHLHCVISDHQYQCYGGHLFAAKVAVTAEIFFTPNNLILDRKFDETTGLSLWNING